MKTRKILQLLICLTGVMNFSVAQAKGTNSGGGGDNCEPRIQEIRDDIANWIQKGGPEGLKSIPVSVADYSSRMTEFLLTAKELSGAIKPVTQIECVHHPIEVQGVEKICRFDQFNWGPKITCYAEGFMDKTTMSDDEQYRLIHHEYAGLAGLEVPAKSQSSYTYSNQLVAFLENQIVKKLAINAKCNDCSVTVQSTRFSKSLESDIKVYSSLSNDLNKGSGLLRLATGTLTLTLAVEAVYWAWLSTESLTVEAVGGEPATGLGYIAGGLARILVSGAAGAVGGSFPDWIVTSGTDKQLSLANMKKYVSDVSADNKLFEDLKLRSKSPLSEEHFKSLSSDDQFRYMTKIATALKVLPIIYRASQKSLEIKIQKALAERDPLDKTYTERLLSLGTDQLEFAKTVQAALAARKTLAIAFAQYNNEMQAEINAVQAIK